MAREVNIFTGNWEALGTNASVPRWSLQVRIDWINNAGAPHTNTRAVTFPNVFAGIPAERLKGYMEQIIMAEARILAGVD